MVTRKPRKAPLKPVPQVTAAEQQGPRTVEGLSNWMIPLLDLQTLWWQNVERNMVDAMRPWFHTGSPLSAQPLFDAVQGHTATAWPWDLKQAWEAWGQLWINALQHDIQNAEEAVRRP